MTKARDLAALLGGGTSGVATFGGTAAIRVPNGTSAQRPTASEGMVRYNTTTGAVEVYDSLGWTPVAASPLITTVSPTTFNGESGTTFTIIGANYDIGVTVKFIDSSGNEYTAASVTRNSSSSLTATTPQDFTVAQEPLAVKVVNSTGLTYTLGSAIDCGGVPAWSTSAGALTSALRNVSYSVTLEATDPDSGASITYAISSGSVPAGTSLNSSTGVISGTPTGSAGTTYNFTAAATDNAGNSTQRAFSIFVNGNSMYQPAGTTRIAALSFDSGSFANTGTLPVYLTGSLSYPAGGARNSSYYSTGWLLGSNYAQVSGMNPLGSSNYTFIAWYKGTQTDTLNLTWNADVTIFGDPRGTVYIGLGLSGGKLSIGYGSQYKGTTTVADNNWHMLAWVWRSNRYVDGYVDGVLEVTVDADQYKTQVRADYIGNGYNYPGALTASAIDAIQIYSGSLTATQILEIYNG